MSNVEELAKAFGNPKRIELINCLADGGKHVTYLHDQCELSQSAVSQHLKVLYNAGLITKDRKHKKVFYELRNDKVADIAEQISNLSTED